ncbi:hypothetical protein MRB53_037267 [Persea americana]|nr:hypothetical protein MRB53_037267 [Persea americana]
MSEVTRAERSQATVKYSKSGIILVPQPSDDPNDPLNWPLWRRDLITGILCLWSELQVFGSSSILPSVGLAPFEALVNASVGDLYFVHERGLRMAISNLCLFGGAFFTPVIVGVIAKNMNWHGHSTSLRSLAQHSSHLVLPALTENYHPGVTAQADNTQAEAGQEHYAEKTPAETIYFSPPLNLTEEQTGYLYTGAFVGAIIGFIIAGILSYVPIWMAKRNNGIFEPEFRLILIVPDVFFGLEVIGMVLGAVASALYLVDAHRDISVEGIHLSPRFQEHLLLWPHLQRF